ncbi:MAG: TVP38/TMEM64 family protein [Oscillospiraceae bacterium]|nr:TVP38/TMEM64 family protein [Oscillospiraceae bacterium]
MNKKHQKIIWILALLIFILFLLAVGWFVGVPMVSLAEDPEAFRLWVDSFGIWGRLIFVGLVTLQVLVAFIPGEPIELAAGYAFGVLEGSLLTMAGFLVGSWLVFALVKKFGVKLVEVFFPQKQIVSFGFLKNPKKTRVIALILMIIPGTPKDFLSYFAGLTRLRTGEWLAIVTVGRIPSLITSTITGAAVGVENYVLSGVMLGITLLITLIGIVYYRGLCKREQEAEKAKTAA